MKKDKSTKILWMILLVLIIVLIAAVSFVGILRRNLNSWENILPDYELSRELDKMRVLTFSVDDSTEPVEETDEEVTDETTTEVNQTVSDDEEISENTEDSSEETETEEEAAEVPVNPAEVLTNTNYDKVKEIIEKRLAKAEINDSEIVVDYETGDINIYVPFNDQANTVADYVTAAGDIQLVDTETQEVLISRDMISSVQSYSMINPDISDSETTSGGSLEYGLQINFTNDGVNKLGEISKTYIDVIDEDGESDPKTLDVQLDGQTVYTTYFDPKGDYQYLTIPVYTNVSESQRELYESSIRIYETNINSGLLPIKYVANYTTYLENDTNKLALNILIIASIAILAIMSIYMIIRYKGKGLFGVISQIGYVALFLLLVRFAKEPLTLFALVSIAVVSILNYVFINKLIKKDSKTTYAQSLVNFALKIMPIIICAIVFVFATSIELKSVGVVLFWGLLALVPYNLIFTDNLFNMQNDIKKIGGKK